MAPAARALDRAGIAVAAIEVVVAPIGIGLENPLPARKMPVGVGHLPVAREVKQRGRRCIARERAIVADIGPEPRRARPALCEQWHCRVVPVEPFGPENMGLDQGMDRRERRGAGADLVRQGRQAEVHAFPGIALGLPIERLVLTELLEQDHGQQVWPRPTTRGRMERRRRLADLLALPAGELLADGLDHLPLPRDHLRRLGDVFPHLHDAV